MSATLEEYEKLAKWIGADVFATNFRPLNLREFVVIDGVSFNVLNNEKDRVIPKEFIIKYDIKNIIGYNFYFYLIKIFCLLVVA